MRDPHVEQLHYRIGSEEGTSYRDPKPLAFSNDLGTFEARDGKLTVEPADHFPDQHSARAVIERFLKAWEIASDLDVKVGMIRFTFLGADIIDRDPATPSSSAIPQAGALALTGHRPTPHLTWTKYPDPPHSFQTTVDVERAHYRWLEYQAGREPLQSMAFFILTMMEASAGGRKKGARVDAGKAFGVESKVLKKVGELTSTRGNPATARKAPRLDPYRDLTRQERAWLERAIQRIIKRLGEHASGAGFSPIRMADLPKLT